MAQVAYSAEASEDLLRLAAFLATEHPGEAEATISLIAEAVSILERHPLMGREIPEGGLRELLISRGHSGYVALYALDPLQAAVTVLAIRHQREVGYND